MPYEIKKDSIFENKSRKISQNLMSSVLVFKMKLEISGFRDFFVKLRAVNSYGLQTKDQNLIHAFFLAN